ncbi:glycosyltransferase [Acinetobacter soli]|uniref:glycosyltransferase n=1 Tax=Acinetobacter soli TaxID=487316 RepID=UPI002813ED97|nr:glycosyltransferase [Acinetobacter soli]MDQ9833081.1 glycosyltransferase [Acinetobacter soli]
MKISVIVPCYNAITKIKECLYSLENQTLDNKLFEVIFVDDCSSDGTYQFLKNYVKSKHNFQVFKLNQNSGSPSKPRNFGVKKAKGEFVFFFDADDSLFNDTLESLYKCTLNNNVDIVRGYFLTDNGEEKKEFNRLDVDFNKLEYLEKIKTIVNKQSLTAIQLVRKTLLDNIKWREDIRMGEDILFALEVFSRTEKIYYLDHPTFIYNQKVDPTRLSSTQTYGKRELVNHLAVWKGAEDILTKVGLSFYELRLRIAIQSVIFALLKFYTHDIDRQLFSQLSKVISDNIHYMQLNKFSSKFIDIIEAIKNNQYDLCFELIKPKLLIAGYDLKFIKPAVPFLEKYYSIQIDEWSGHEIHDPENSKKLLDWADIIFCEWLLGNAVWYANNKKEHQKLIVRLHRFELTTKYIGLVDTSKIDKLITVSYYFYEKTLEILSIARSKVTIISNYLLLENYIPYNGEDKLYNIGMIGILPIRKGYYNSLTILKKLVDKDTKYKLHIYGKHPSELSWIKNNAVEMEYYDKCDVFIKNNNLSNNVVFHGWSDISKEVGKIGYVLSVSDDEEIPESFHIAPAEAFAVGNIGLFLPWRGVEYIYPKEYILKDVDSITSYIIDSNQDYNKFKENAKLGYRYIKENYSIEKFCHNFFNLLSSTF